MGKAEEAREAAVADEVAPPPAYSEATQSDAAPAYPADIKPTSRMIRQFPPSFAAFCQWKFTRTFHLGESKEHPLYAVRTHTGWSGTPGIVLHSGPSDKDPPLAAAGNEKSWSKHSTIILPPLPGTGQDSSSEFMRTNMGWKTVTYPFTIEVGNNGNLIRENFEWRQSHGGEIKQLDKYTRGWKLVRLGSAADGPGGGRTQRAHGVTSDGEEIVAVWTFYSGWSLTKFFKFQFMGSGLTGELGERWAIMAVVTALRIWSLHYDGNNSAAGASAGAAAAAAAVAST